MNFCDQILKICLAHMLLDCGPPWKYNCKC